MRDLIKSIKAYLAILARVVKPAFDFWIESVKTWWRIAIVGSLQAAGDILAAASPAIKPIVDAFTTAIETSGGPIADSVRAPVAALARGAFSTSAAGLSSKGASTPDNALETAANAFADAFGFGISSAAVAAAFEAAFPEKLNVLNGIAPMLANMAGFEEITKAVLGPLYANAFEKSLDYHFRSVFKPELPDEADAVTWHARRLLTDPQLRTIFGFSGLKPEYEEAFVASAYRAVQPRAMATAFVDVEFPEAAVRSMLEFAGIRPADLEVMLEAFKLGSVKNLRQQYVSALTRSWELGTINDADGVSALHDLQFSDDAINLVQLTVATRKLEQLAELYRKSISEAYAFGSISDADYVPSLEAIGIAAADAQAHYAIDSIKKHGKEAAALARAAAAEARFIDRVMIAAAKADYHAGILGDLELAARFTAAQMPALAIPFAVEIEIQRQKSKHRLVFGVLVGPREAIILREQVAALKEQRIKKLIDDPTALAQLASFGVPARNATDLVAEWAAQAEKILNPIA